ncbi:MAG: choice-of-anchor D domain-containing protein [Terriglobia bacterium]|jgi:hypothetical protein
METRAVQRQRANAVILSTACIALLALSITDNALGSPQSMFFGRGSPAVSLSPTSLAFGNQSVGKTSTAHTVNLSNTGNAALSITSLALTGTNGSNFAETNTCGKSLAAGARCTISVTFTPSASGSRKASLSITDNARGSPQTVSLSGTGTAAVVSLSPTSLVFGSQAVGKTSTAHTVNLSNTGNAALSITTLALTGTNASDFAQTNTCRSSVAAGAHCTISVTFTPSGSGSRTASVSITDNAAGSPQSVSLTGTGNNPQPSLTSLSPASGIVGAAAQTLTLNGTNFLASSTVTYNGVGHTATFVSSMQLTISLSATDQATAGSYAVVVTNPAPGGGASSPLNFAVGNPQPSLSSLSPASAVVSAAAQTLTLNGTNFLASSTVTYNGVGHTATFVSSTQLTISLSATDQATAGSYAVVVTNPAPGGGASSPLNFTVASPIVSLSPTSLGFGNQAIDMTSATKTVTLSNTGNAALSITSLALTGTNASDFAQANTCGSSLAVGANCTIVVMFTPSVTGTEASSLSIADNSSGSPQTVSLSGAGTHDVILSWTASTTPGVVGYNVYRGTTSGGPYPTELNSAPINGTTYTDETVQAGRTYYYVVTAVASNDVTQSANSNQVSAAVPSP